MRSRSIVIAILLAFGSKAYAGPPQNAPAQPVQSQQEAHALVLASADAVQAGAAEASPAAPVQPRHRIARITTCRCGDPQPDHVSDDGSGDRR